MSLAETGRRMTAITMGIDRFERSRNAGTSLLDGEGLVPIYLGDDVVEAKAYEDWAQVNSDIEGLSEDIGALPGGERKVFFEGMLTSLKYAVRLFSGDEPSFEEKVVHLVGARRASSIPRSSKPPATTSTRC